ncbi:CYP5206 protein [Mucor lusitanicus CBS 277.49]|uniref:CYP5206 protein n=1 Tax=Mucor lusitanicus CBS 277.49 TaxID=747725 RepID=A0A162TJV9_MUCCL|nr:CYP5206 protein [Mucor lusitanicus CBS 277.49]
MLDDWKACRSHYLFPLLSCFTLMSSAAAAYYMNKKHTRISFLKNHKTTTHTEQIPSPPNKFPIIGPLYQLQLGSQTWIMIADPIIAHEIFVKQGSKSSSRPYHTFAVKIYGRNNRGIIFSSYSPKWKCERKAATAVLSPKSVDRFSEILEFEADSFIERIAQDNENAPYINPYENLQLCSLNIITTTCLAIRFDTIEDPIFQKIAKFVHGSMIYAGMAGDMGSFFPTLAWLDTLMRKEKEMQSFVHNYRDVVYEKLVSNALNGDAECLVKNLYQMMDEMNLDEDDILVFMSDFIGAGADTIAVSLYWTFAILSQMKDVQDRVIKELDDWREKHNNKTEFPVFNLHREEFPYTMCVQKEIMRFRPTTNFGIPHSASDEIVIGNYVIPKDAILVSSMAAMHMNPEFYEHPEVFNPDRFMNNTQRMSRAANCKPQERDHFGFGWGKRICPGIHLAEVEIFNIYVRLFSKFTIEPQLDEAGNPILIDLNDFEDYGIVAKPLPFNVRLIPRDKN